MLGLVWKVGRCRPCYNEKNGKKEQDTMSNLPKMSPVNTGHWSEGFLEITKASSLNLMFRGRTDTA